VLTSRAYVEACLRLPTPLVTTSWRPCGPWCRAAPCGIFAVRAVASLERGNSMIVNEGATENNRSLAWTS
jgi:hypothetical protein